MDQADSIVEWVGVAIRMRDGSIATYELLAEDGPVRVQHSIEFDRGSFIQGLTGLPRMVKNTIGLVTIQVEGVARPWTAMNLASDVVLRQQKVPEPLAIED